MDGALTHDEATEATTDRLGTRFLVFPQAPFVPGYKAPEVVLVSTAPGDMQPGPADERMYVVRPSRAKAPYEYPYLPPFDGAREADVEPGPDGHFDHLAVGTPEFEAAHVFACVRRMLDIAESYWGETIPWFFAEEYERLEIIPHLPWDNAQTGFGFLEMGEDHALGEPHPFALNFDTIAHETAHLVLLGIAGMPTTDPPEDFFAFHEAAADFVGLLGLLHFDTAVDKILRRTRGNLLVNNELDRFGELSEEKQVRLFSNSLKLSDVSQEEHDRSKPFTGALFDAFLEIYQIILVERDLSELDPRRYWNLRRELPRAEIEAALNADLADYAVRHFAHKAALEVARDIMGRAFVRSWGRLPPETTTLRSAADALVETMAEGRDARFVDSVVDAFAWRELQ